MNLQQHLTIIQNMKSAVNKRPTYQQMQAFFAEAQYLLEEFPAERERAFAISNYVKSWYPSWYADTGDEKFLDLYWKCMKWESPYLLDSYCLYIEKDRPDKEKFYQPRRKTLKQVVDALQKLEDDELDELFIHMPARVGKTQIITIATSWHCCRNTELSNLYCSYKEDAGGAFLEGITEIWTDPIYCHNDIFPLAKIVDTDAKSNTIDLERKKKYKSISGKGLTSGLNGLYDATGWLIADDVLEGVQDVLSQDILKRKKTIFYNNLMKRKKEKCKVVYNGTIWSLSDIFMDRVGFLESNPEAKNIRWDVIKIPALNPDTDESNFDYDYNLGFNTQYYRTERAKFEEDEDMAGWYSQCQQEPIEREGAVFNPEHMNYFKEIELPEEEPFKKIAACDVALGGKDFLAFAVAYVYEDNSAYIVDTIFDSSGKEKTQPKVVDMIIKHNLKSAFFESNQGGEGYKDDIKRLLKERKDFNEGRGITLDSKFAPNQKRKEQRIWDNAPEIRKLFFRKLEERDLEYKKFMNNLFSFTITGKNKFDDAPDSLSMLVEYNKKGSGVKVSRIIPSPI